MHHAVSFDFVNLQRRVLFDELFDTHEAAPNFNVHLIAFLHFYINAALAELVNALGLAYKENLQLAALRVLVEEGAQAFVYCVLLPANVDGTVVVELLDLLLAALELLDELQAHGLRLEQFLLQLNDLLVQSGVVFLYSFFRFAHLFELVVQDLEVLGHGGDGLLVRLDPAVAGADVTLEGLVLVPNLFVLQGKLTILLL